MSYLLFVDESGTPGATPYEVLAGVAVRDEHLWPLICRIRDAEESFFGTRITAGSLELKAKKLLKRKTFRLAAQLPPLARSERTELAQRCLAKGDAVRGTSEPSGVTRKELTALAQAKIAFTEHVLDLCSDHHARAFASIITPEAPRTEGDFLRKDYSYLFERFFYFLEDRPGDELGMVVFDELERSGCHLLVDQMGLYFQRTGKGRSRAGRVIPEPLFVHSDLTTAVQLADLVAYIVCWSVRFGSMSAPRRKELDTLAQKVMTLRYRTTRELMGNPAFEVWSFKLIEDLRGKEER